MIYDNLVNSAVYAHDELLKIAFDYIKAFNGAPNGRYELSSGVFALVQRYNTKPEAECRFETHKKYIDLQYVVKGCERIAAADYRTLVPSVEYDPARDIRFFTGKGGFMELNGGDFMILYPWDAHMPQIGAGGEVQKIVVKIPYKG